MRCLHIIGGDLWAGAEVSAYSLMVELARRPSVELEAVLFCEGELAARLRDVGIRVQVFSEQHLSFPSLLRSVVASFRDRPPEIVHSHKTKEHVVGSALAVRYGSTQVRSLHGMPPHLSWDGSLLCVADLLADTLADLSESTWIAVSRDLATQVAGLRRIVHVVPNGLPEDPPQPDRAPLAAAFPDSPAGRRVGFVGRLEEVKRPDRFVQVMAKLLETDEVPDVRGIVVGDGSLRGEVASRIERMGLQNRVRMLGHRNEAERILGALDALVICSDHEGHPMVLLEAMRAGVPVVSFDVGGIHEVIGDSPWLVPAGDERAMADALARILTDGSAHDRWSRQLRSVFSERYTIRRTADRVLSIYAAGRPEGL